MKPGDSLDQFLIVKKLGHGGMGGVFIGFDPETDSLCAVKVLIEEYSEDETYVKRFEREAEILSRLTHPNIIQLIDSGKADGRHYMVLEYVKGKTLTDYLISGFKFNVDVVVSFAKDMLRTLGYSHSQGVIHRDIKPENIMLPNGSMAPKLLDFGVAFIEDSLIKTATGKFVGTLTYASPEQVQGQAADQRSDLYSAGLVFYEMLTDQKAIHANGQAAVLQAQMDEAYVSPSQLNPVIPPRLSQIVLRSLRANPKERYQSAEEFLIDLENFANEYSEMATNSTSVYDFPEFEKQFSEANAAFEAKDFEQAVHLAQDLAQKAPRAAEVFFLLGKIYLETGYTYNAIEEYIKATVFNPSNSYYQMALALAYKSIGAFAQARQVLEMALSLDPESRVIRQRLEEMGQDGDAPIGDGTGAGFSDGADISDNELAHGRKPYQEKLDDMVGKLPSIPAVLAPTLIWWGWGPYKCSSPGLSSSSTRMRVITASLVQLVFLGMIFFFYHNPKFFQEGSLLVSQGSDLHKLLRDPTSLMRLCLGIYFFAGTYFLFQAYKDSRVAGMTAFITADRTSKNIQTINRGFEGGVVRGAVFYIFAPRDPHSGAGKFIGRLYIERVESHRSEGLFHPETSDRPCFGDVAVAYELLTRGLANPRIPNPVQFLQIPENLRPLLDSAE